MAYVKPRWKIEVRGTVHPPHVWSELRSETKRYAFIERPDAEKEMARLKRVQPHIILRVAPV